MSIFDDIENTIAGYNPISLEEMSGVRMMNRTDTKYVVSISSLREVLDIAAKDYRVQEVDGERLIGYHTVYFDTADQQMYIAHQNGRKTREKIRLRTYVSSGLTFFEVKNKNNRGRTDKKRIRVPLENADKFLAEDDTGKFLKKHAWYAPTQLTPQLENFFRRITLVNLGMTERLTVDTRLSFHNLLNGTERMLPGVAIIELKRDGLTWSPMHDLLVRLHIHTSGFSKYCIGYAMTEPRLKQNRFKERIRNTLKLNGENNNND